MAKNSPEQQAKNQKRREAASKGPGGGGLGQWGKDYGGPRPAPVTPAPTTGPAPGTPSSLITKTEPDPRVTATTDKAISNIDTRQANLTADEKTVDPNLQFQIDEYKKRLSNDVTQRESNRVAGATRSQMALQQKQANEQSALIGGSAGARGAAIAGQAGRNLAKANADIQMGRQRDLDALVLGGQGVMAAPSQQGLIKSGNLNQFTLGGAGVQLNAAQAPAQLALQQGQQGLNQYMAQNSVYNQQQQLALQQQAQQNQLAQQQIDNYMKMIQMGGGYPGATGFGGFGGVSNGNQGAFGNSGVRSGGAF